jgi:hypothetical protein
MSNGREYGLFSNVVDDDIVTDSFMLDLIPSRFCLWKKKKHCFEEWLIKITTDDAYVKNKFTDSVQAITA